MIRDTSIEIGELYKRWQGELETRYARRNKVRYIDHLLNELELLNLSESREMPQTLRHEVKGLIDDSEHSLCGKDESHLTIQESMEALYEIQETLLLGGGEEEEEL
jgi:hypothetical protein